MKKFIGVFLAIILIISQSTLVFADKNGANLNLKCKISCAYGCYKWKGIIRKKLS